MAGNVLKDLQGLEEWTVTQTVLRLSAEHTLSVDAHSLSYADVPNCSSDVGPVAPTPSAQQGLSLVKA